METFRVLIVDDDEVIRRNLVNYLTRFHKADYKLEVDSAENVKDAVSKMKDGNFNLVIADINMPDESGFDLIQKINDNYPGTKTAMITAYKVEDYLKLAREKNVSNIIVKTAPFNFDELSTVINGLLIPDKYIFGLHNYLAKGTELKHYIIESSDSIATVQTLIRKSMHTLNIPNIELLSIAILEAITNAIYHAPRTPEGTEKYQRGNLIEQLESNEIVEIHYGWDHEKLGISVTDQGGKLSKSDILYWLNRNVTGSGVLDTHGRGFYLMHCIVDRLVINIKTGEKTELVFLIYYKDSYTGHKPIYINQI